MSDIAIRVEGLSKQYRIGGKQERYKTLRDTLADVARVPMQALQSLAGRNGRLRDSAETIWALKDVSFEVKRGEVVGIIGRNGAGKSTLLKILSRITEPTEGQAEVYGRVGSLLEVGTGFHAELTGWENIYLNGAILGMKRAEIKRRFDEIVTFAEVEKFVDTPVKHFSSGMYLRLAFAVAAHLEPELLLVDEVLAVGDADFQKKCLGKMGEVARAGRTVLFVSHNMTAIKLLCPRTAWLANGRVVQDGQTPQTIAAYLNSVSEGGAERVWPEPQQAPGNSRVRLHAVRVISAGLTRAQVDIDKEVQVDIEFWNLIPGSRLFADIFLLDSMGGIVLESANTPGANQLPEKWFGQPYPRGLFRSTCVLPANFLNEGRYYLSVIIGSCNPPTVEAQAQQVVSFTVFDTGAMRTPGFGGRWNGVVRVRLPWHTALLKPAQGKPIEDPEN